MNPAITLKALPFYMVALHRMARLGYADAYQGLEKQIVNFQLPNHFATAKWDDMKDFESLTIIYRVAAEKRAYQVWRAINHGIL